MKQRVSENKLSSELAELQESEAKWPREAETNPGYRIFRDITFDLHDARAEIARLNAEIEEGKRREGTLVRLIDSANETANNRQDEIERKDMHLRNIVVFTSVDLMREAARAALRSEIEG